MHDANYTPVESEIAGVNASPGWNPVAVWHSHSEVRLTALPSCLYSVCHSAR